MKTPGEGKSSGFDGQFVHGERPILIPLRREFGKIANRRE
jgi:hypothetical protein